MTEKESHTKKFIEGAAGGAVLGAFGSIWILNELETWIGGVPLPILLATKA